MADEKADATIEECIAELSDAAEVWVRWKGRLTGAPEDLRAVVEVWRAMNERREARARTRHRERIEQILREIQTVLRARL